MTNLNYTHTWTDTITLVFTSYAELLLQFSLDIDQLCHYHGLDCCVQVIEVFDLQEIAVYTNCRYTIYATTNSTVILLCDM